MKKILILKTGDTFKDIKEKYGDFEDWIINRTGLSSEYYEVYTVFHGKALNKKISDFKAIIITGSHYNVTDNSVWIKYSCNIIKEAQKQNIPMLGICFGHQLLAYSLGGKVNSHPKGIEAGNVEILLNEEGKQDILLRILPENFFGLVNHSQTIAFLPPDSVPLASNDFEKHQAFRFGNNIWGIQFHPEFDLEISKEYMYKLENEIIKSGTDFEMLLADMPEFDYGESVLKRFIEII